MGELISVIVPIYNVEEFLNRCIESIVNQSYKNLEIILVDDGSPDNSGLICDDWGKKDSRITVIHKENGGLSDARNAGIEIAKGDYFSFIDSDDYVHRDFIKILYELLIKNNGDISMCGVKKTSINEDINKNIEEIPKKILYSKKILLGEESLYCVAWNKLYKRKLFNEIRYPVGKIHEDVAVIHKIIYYSEKIVVTDRELYFYYDNPNSIMRQSYSEKRLDILDGLHDSYNFFLKENESDYAFQVLKEYLDNVLNEYKNVSKYQRGNSIIKKLLKEKYRESYREVIKNSNISLISKLKYIFYAFSPSIYIFISKQ